MTTSLRLAVLGLLQQGPLCQPQLSKQLGAPSAAVGKILARLAGEKKIRVCGFAIDAGLAGESPRSPMWGMKDAKPFRAVGPDGERLACAACGAHQVYRLRKYNHLECRTCSTRFFEGEARPTVEEHRPHSTGSGQIAGRITIGRGMRWAWVG